MAKTHELKCWPEYFEAMVSGDKPFDLRFNDRGFEVGDMLALREWKPANEEYSGRSLHCRIGYVLEGSGPGSGSPVNFGLQPGYVVLGISRMSTWEVGDGEE